MHRQLGAAIEAYEPQFLGNLVLALDSYFVHRARALEEKDGNALHGVSMLCNSMMTNNYRLGADKTIKNDPAKSVLKYRIGDEIKVKEAGFLLSTT